MVVIVMGGVSFNAVDDLELNLIGIVGREGATRLHAGRAPGAEVQRSTSAERVGAINQRAPGVHACRRKTIGQHPVNPACSAHQCCARTKGRAVGSGAVVYTWPTISRASGSAESQCTPSTSQ